MSKSTHHMQKLETCSYIFITGGVISSLGKGLTSAALGMLLERRGLKVALMKLDPYFNVDPGTMNPYQHGEVYVTDDGAETDLDLGHYSRFTHSPLSKSNSTSSGQIFKTVIENERKGRYLGQTIQMIPHITDEIQERILNCAKKTQPDVLLVEIGGTAGDIESLPFLEAIRQFRHRHWGKCINLHMTYVPYVKAAGEIKTKPTQHSVQTLRSIGITPDLLICRSEIELPQSTRDKIALFCNTDPQAVYVTTDVDRSIYEVPLHLYEQKIDQYICEKLKFPLSQSQMQDWKDLLDEFHKSKKHCTIAIVGKYIDQDDAYKSIYESLQHAALHSRCKIHFARVKADELQEENLQQHLGMVDGVLVPGGFGDRGWEGKILAAKFCREHKIPYFGICMGMQAACVEYARHVCGLQEANSTEFNTQSPHPIISLIDEQKEVVEKGGTMRLGSYACQIEPQTLLAKAYGSCEILERHRHRYEFNEAYASILQKNGLKISGRCKDSQLVEAIELENHPWMLAVQYHPEFKSRVLQPHSLFVSFCQAAYDHSLSKSSHN